LTTAKPSSRSVCPATGPREMAVPLAKRVPVVERIRLGKEWRQEYSHIHTSLIKRTQHTFGVFPPRCVQMCIYDHQRIASAGNFNCRECLVFQCRPKFCTRCEAGAVIPLTDDKHDLSGSGLHLMRHPDFELFRGWVP